MNNINNIIKGDKILNRYLQTGKEEFCYGCGMCEMICPTEAIVMTADEKGFRYPVLNEKKCIGCRKCENVCPISISDKYPKNNDFYVVYHKNEGVREKSQSGGFFTALSDYFLSEDGVVYGAAIGENFEVVHIRAEDENIRNQMRGSKYVQSVIYREVLEQMEEDIRKGRKVLFMGTPCQCAMVKKNYNGYKNLLVCEFLCHGTPSPKIWKDYLKLCESMWGKITGIVFRNYKGVNRECIYTEDSCEHTGGKYAGIFYSKRAHRPSCFECQFACEERYGDITCGGFLDGDINGELNIMKSMVMIHNDKAETVFKEISQFLNIEKKKMFFMKNQPALYNHFGKPQDVNEFYHDYFDKGIEYALDSILLMNGKND
ncbi:MAG: Coenzyme F420 hydrogenase/dehydrogenase, beta subunit C-terminal domain [Lachnospiraceae bacterium]